MTPRKRISTTAWLGLLAMWLIVFAPVVSQFVASAHAADPAGYICSAAHPDDAARQPAATDLAACGYCDLLADHPAAPAMPAPPPTLVLLIAFVAAAALFTRFVPLGAFPSGRPRAPPALPRLRP
ncbi:DUF2946 domain-containing protein [Cupriavidus basilensis]|uniref:DUF2946 domain-containing protein n=1 Tax=Cupriavidus basilensis TaxID=68895 RepID=UPI0007517E6D|nr:DUF2946 domain-containing protein [Cupriavidus basilensis]